jgi:hypothetical protein
MGRIKIYIASPYSVGDKLQNVRLQIDAFHILRDLGHIPIPPLTSHWINEVRERTHKDWIDYDLEILSLCNMVIRLRPIGPDGIEIPSAGADIEEKEAKILGIPYYEFNTLEEMEVFFGSMQFKL